MKHTILITGAAGYVGSMIIDRCAKRDDVARIIGLDKEPVPDDVRNVEKLEYIEMNTIDEWEVRVRAARPDIVIHTAWQIRELYGKQDLEWRWNVCGSDRVFDFALTEPSVKRLIHFSTVASYGALPENTIEHRYTENEQFRKTDYRYAEEKRVAEEHLKEKYEKSDTRVSVVVLRPVAITGPRGRFARVRFGLQSSLSGSLKGKGSFLYDVVSLLLSWMPVTKKWLRQYIHEDDIANIVERVAFDDPVLGYEVFNLCPPGSAMLGRDMARVVGKRALPVAPWMVRIAFFIFWHATRGGVPTARGSWRGYAYPIAIDGTKLTHRLGYRYRYKSSDAFQYTDGDYEHLVPEPLRRHKK